jgi:hypothetical protein
MCLKCFLMFCFIERVDIYSSVHVCQMGANYRAIGLVLDFIHRLPHTRRLIKSKTSQIALYNIHHRQNPFKSIRELNSSFLMTAFSRTPICRPARARKIEDPEGQDVSPVQPHTLTCRPYLSSQEKMNR